MGNGRLLDTRALSRSARAPATCAAWVVASILCAAVPSEAAAQTQDISGRLSIRANARVSCGSAQTREALRRVNVIDFGSGSKGVQAFVAGEVDFVAATFEHSIRLNSKGIPARSVVSLSKAPGIVMGVTKSFEPDFKEMKDLVGKAVGVSAPGSASHTFL